MKAKEYYALVKEGIEAGTATALKGAVDEMFMGMNREVRELEIIRESLENMPDTWIAQQYLEKWDGKLPQFITGDGSGVMLAPDLE